MSMLSFETGTKLVLLVAPAGFGKSTAARQLSERHPDAIVIDDGRDVPALEAALDALWRDRPSARAIMCSRHLVRVPFRHAMPHEVRLVRAADLRLNAREIARLFARADASPEQLDAAYRITLGWPAAVAAAAELARERGTRQALREISAGDPTFARYVETEVLPSLSADARHLVALASLGSLTLEDSEMAVGEHRNSALEEIDDALLFASRRGTYSLHPLLRASARAADARAHAASLAAAYERAPAPLGAARWYLRAGMPAEATAAFKSQRFAHLAEISSEDSDAAAQLDPAHLLEDLSILNIAMAERLYERDRERWFVLAEEALRRAPPSVDVQIRSRVLLTLVMRSCYFARFDDARRIVANERARGFADATYETALAFCDAYLHTTQDAYVDLSALRARLGPHLLNTFWRVPYASVASYTHGAQGDWAAARAEWEVMLEANERWGRRSQAAEALMGAAFFAWLYGDDKRFDLWLSAIESLEASAGTALFERCVHAPDAQLSAGANETPQSRVYAHVIAAARAHDAGRRVEHARVALAEAGRTGRPFFSALAHIALGLLNPAERDDHFKRAGAYAKFVHSPELQRALDAIAASSADAGMLQSFRNRFAPAGPANAELRINIIAGAVEWNGRTLDLNERPRDVLFALTLAGRPVRPEELAARVWPDRDPAHMQNALRVHIASLRKSIHPSAIVHESGCYRVDVRCIVDLEEGERIVRRAHSSSLDEAAREILTSLLHAATRRAGPHTELEWMAPIERRVQSFARSAALALCGDALARGDATEAASYVKRLIDEDPCDERARSLAIRAHLQLGDRDEAVREYRDYRRAVQAELNIDPGSEQDDVLDAIIDGVQPERLLGASGLLGATTSH